MTFLVEFLIAFLAVIAVPVYYYYKKVYRCEKFLKNYPGPPKTFILGNARQFSSFAEMLPTMHKNTKEYGDKVHLKLGLFNSLVCSDPKFLEFLMTSSKMPRNGDVLRFLTPWIGYGLINLDGPKWKMHRRLITPAFHLGILEQFVDIFESAADILVAKLSEESGNASVDIYPYVSKCTLDVICETAMGMKLDVQNNDTSAYFKSINDMREIFLIRIGSLLKRFDFFFKFSKEYAIQKESAKVVQKYTQDVVERKRKELEESANENEVDDLGRKKKKVFLDLILQAKEDNQSLTEEELTAEVNTFMFGGHDTTATAISYALYCLADNKQVQDKILEEQRNLFGDDKNPKVTYKDLQEMKYLENVIKESLRLYPPVPMYGKIIDRDLSYDGKLVPEDTQVLIFVHGLHMNPKYYPNPEKFDPSRFENKPPNFTYLPFGAGPRACIGQKYAMLEMKSLISKIVRHFELVPASPRHEMILVPELVLKSQNGVKIGLKLR